MSLQSIMAFVKRTGQEVKGSERSVPDDETTDKYLRSLRRQRRVQLEEFEKEKLQKDILEHQRMRGRSWLITEKPLLERKGNFKNSGSVSGKKLRFYDKSTLL